MQERERQTRTLKGLDGRKLTVCQRRLNSRDREVPVALVDHSTLSLPGLLKVGPIQRSIFGHACGGKAPEAVY